MKKAAGKSHKNVINCFHNMSCFICSDSDSLQTQGLPNRTWYNLPSLQRVTGGKPVLAARFVTWILRKVVEARTDFVSGLEMTVLSESNRLIF